MRFPYERWKTDPLWAIVNIAISDLVKNADLKELTARDYIVGYIVMKIRSALDQLTPESPISAPIQAKIAPMDT